MDPVTNACAELFERDAGPPDTTGRLLVACSGGMDSVVLLHAVARAAERHVALDRLLAIHVDHGLAPESREWAARCRAQAEALGVAVEVHRLAISSGSNLEARARTARYQVFESRLGPADVLLLAHHAGDQLESQLLHLFQGRGLYGMPESRALGAGRLRRPLLGLPREALAGYARSHDLSWIEDPSNADERLDRNYLRHRLLPGLKKRFQGLPKRIGRVAANLRDTAAALDELAGLDRQPLPLAVFDGLSQPARLALLRRWLTLHADAGGVSRLALTEFLRQLDAGNDRQPSLPLPAGRLVRFRRALHLAPEPPALQSSYPLSVPNVLLLPHGTLTIECRESTGATEEFEFVQLVPPACVTFAAVPAEAAAGARIQVGGHQRGVRDLMRQAGVAPWLRASLPLLTDSRGVALIPGVATRDPAAAAGAERISVGVRWAAAGHESR